MNLQPLTGTTLQVLGAIEWFHREHGYAPSIRDIVALEGLSSPSVVHRHLRKLREMGYITFEDGISRSIVLLGREKR